MTYFTRPELEKLAKLCQSRKYEADWIIASNGASDLDKDLAQFESDYMDRLSKKLLSVAESNARRVEITF